MRAEQRVADQRATADAGLLGTLVEDGQRLLAVLGETRRRVAVLDDLVVAHQLARPLDRADADAQQRQPQAEAEGDVGGAQSEEHARGRRRRRRRSRRRRTAARRRSRGRTAWRPGARRACSRASSTSVGRGCVLGQPRVGDRLGLDRVASSRLSLMACSFFLVERAGLAPIQTAKPTRAPMPTSQANRPSETGTERAEREAAVGRGLLVLLQVGDDLLLVLRGEHLVGEDRHLLRTGQHRLVHVLLGDPHQRRARSGRAAGRRRRRRSCGRPCSWCGRTHHRGRRPRCRRRTRRSRTRPGTAGPGPREATYAASASISSWS